ncbi:hypothetical protein [Tardiphaga sp. vice278]|uniref:hypothetical protein n=1 Tax=Tardiphaga sp. vice278 TaxID=2592815 RepID=UPI001165A6A2|nr:hypothetical protein [Tardiphaga sp. vice278]QDM18183.1 hypothetical protein FNL53_21280 [Tardiphaga sp. vice278]
MDHQKLTAPVPDIELRWALRDIRAKRTTILPPKPEHLEELLGRGWVEMRSGEPIVTEAGLDAMDVY